MKIAFLYIFSLIQQTFSEHLVHAMQYSRVKYKTKRIKLLAVMKLMPW